MMNAMSYPVSAAVEPQLGERDRLTTALRLVLAIPHLILVGGVGVGFAANSSRRDLLSFGGETGLLGSIAFLLAIVSWFTIVITSEHYTPIRRYTRYYLRWRVRALAFLMLLADVYPPFGDAPYPATMTLVEPGPVRDRLSVGLRLIFAIPHFVVLFFVLCAWWVTTVVSWFAILITGRYPPAFYGFGVGALRWLIRVEAYMLLLVDEYPPFSLT
jgi:Domain of unknown function (DUF4389)